MKKKILLIILSLTLILGSVSVAVAAVTGGEEKNEAAKAADAAATGSEKDAETKAPQYEVTMLHSVVSGAAVVGSHLQILDKDGNIMDDWITDGTDHVINARLIAGETYTLHEVSAPAGYVLAPDVTFTVSEDGSIDEIVMQDDYTKIQFVKLSELTGELLADVHMQVWDKDGKAILDWITDGTIAQVDGLLVAGETYTLHEVSAPNGYVLADDVTFTVGTDGELQTITMTDDYTKVRIKKTTK
ncbi:MAG: SpaA isopeptide-forming pilin-related protein [Lachnospiraceae bacterium]|nr:SpaA isopeptide-forming pilin-related protein [Lachnospiraceae bacterium]